MPETMYRTSMAAADHLQVDDVVVVGRLYLCRTSHVGWWDGLLEVMGDAEGSYPAWFRATAHGLAHGLLNAIPVVPVDA